MLLKQYCKQANNTVNRQGNTALSSTSCGECKLVETWKWALTSVAKPDKCDAVR